MIRLLPIPVRATAWAAVWMLALFARPCLAQQDEAFKIGYLLSGAEENSMRPVIEQLRLALLANDAVMNAMRALGYEDIWLRPSDEPFDMIQRLGAREFELAFATSVIYARQFRPRPGEPEMFQAADYEPVFQFRRIAGDIVDPRGNGVFRRGMIFAGPASALWGKKDIAPDQLRKELERERLAVSDSYSATSYIYPRLRLADGFTTLTLRGELFCESESAVVKHVVAGLAALGACDAEALGELEAGKHYQELLRTDPIPADPILLRADFLPGREGGDLGRELKVALQGFFNSPSAPIKGVKIERAERRAFEDMARALARFDALQQPASPEEVRAP